MIPFYRPYFDRCELLAALRPGTGRSEFEATLAARLDARYGIAFAYGRAGIIATLKALGLTQAEVILPAYTCLVVAQAVVASGNKPVFVDIDLADYNMDLAAIREALTSRTRAIIATHLYGYPTDVDAIRAAAGNERIIIVEDRAQGLFTSFAGTTELRGDIGLCSFGPNKQLCTVQGGVIITNSSSLYQQIKAYRDREMNLPSARTWAKRWARLIAMYLVFRQPVFGFLQRAGLIGRSSRLDKSSDLSPAALRSDYATAYMDFQGRVGLVQLGKLDTIVSGHCALAELYDHELRHVPGLSPAPIITGATYAYYTLRVTRRDELNFPQQMFAQGVAVDYTFDYVLPFLKPYRPYARGNYPRAEQAAREVVNLPIYPGLSAASARYVAKCTRRALYESLKS